jgi:hypothetical protein
MATRVPGATPYSSYWTDVDGNVYDPPGVPIEGRFTPRGYVTYRMLNDDTGRTDIVWAHRFVYSAFRPIPEGYVIDHKVPGARGRSDNRLDNLQALTNAEHLAKTREDYPDGFKHGVRVVATSQTTGVATPFKSTAFAAEVMQVSEYSVKAALDDGEWHQGYMWAREVTTELPGEEWFTIDTEALGGWAPPSTQGLVGMQVSNHGRVMSGNQATYGSLIGNTMVVIWKGQQRSVAQVVCHAFCGPTTFAGAHAWHKDGDRRNNHEDNLRWVRGMSRDPLGAARRAAGGTLALKTALAHKLLDVALTAEQHATLMTSSGMTVTLHDSVLQAAWDSVRSLDGMAAAAVYSKRAVMRKFDYTKVLEPIGVQLRHADNNRDRPRYHDMVLWANV